MIHHHFQSRLRTGYLKKPSQTHNHMHRLFANISLSQNGIRGYYHASEHRFIYAWRLSRNSFLSPSDHLVENSVFRSSFSSFILWTVRQTHCFSFYPGSLFCLRFRSFFSRDTELSFLSTHIYLLHHDKRCSRATGPLHLHAEARGRDCRCSVLRFCGRHLHYAHPSCIGCLGIWKQRF
ncbi:hypothetical protein SCHPADRAFT_386580 [Schizopora paradoxa]|uniref:Uncharacterized protein n=1 Tax=Schizopora paradoxa TaxID=27342 RepID=A0A0H2RMG7_9AGAM|nr:hypothetical protein SCHPADRAFT_386580 [Schizopora paradoxa]